MKNNGIFIDTSLEMKTRPNRRRHHRRKVNWTVEGRWQNKRNFTAYTIDISRSGILMHTAHEFIKGEKAYIKINTFTHGEHRTIDAVIEVKHSSINNNQFNCGVLFLKVSEKHRAFLHSFLNGKNPHNNTIEPSTSKSGFSQVDMLN